MILTLPAQTQADIVKQRYKDDMNSAYILDALLMKLRHRKPYSCNIPNWTQKSLYLFYRWVDVSVEHNNSQKATNIFIEEICDLLEIPVEADVKSTLTESSVDVTFQYNAYDIRIVVFGTFANCKYITVKAMEEVTHTIVHCGG